MFRSLSYVDEDLHQCIPHPTDSRATTYQPTTSGTTTLENDATTNVQNNNESNPTYYSTITENEVTSVSYPTHVTPRSTNEDGQFSVIVTIITSTVVGTAFLLSCIVLLSSVLCYRSKKSQRRKLPKSDWSVKQTDLTKKETRKASRESQRRQHISIGSLARTPAFFTTPKTSTSDRHFSSHDNHMTSTNEAHFHTPNVRSERPPINSTTLSSPTINQEPLISAHINACTYSMTPGNKTPSPNLIRSINQRTQQPPTTMGVGGVYSTHTHHPHRGTLSSSRGTSSRMSHSSSQRHSRTSSSGVSSMRVTVSTRTSVNSLNGLLE